MEQQPILEDQSKSAEEISYQRAGRIVTVFIPDFRNYGPSHNAGMLVPAKTSVLGFETGRDADGGPDNEARIPCILGYEIPICCSTAFSSRTADQIQSLPFNVRAWKPTE
jgi:hypothetical protein